MSDATPSYPSRATKITLYEDRAEVARRASVRAQAGMGWVALEGVTPLLEDRSVQAALVGQDHGQVRILATRVKRTLSAEPAGNREVAALEAAQRAAQARAVAVGRRMEAQQDQAARLDALLGQWAEGLARVPDLDGPAQVERWREAWGSLVEASQESARALHALRAEHAQAQDALALAKARLAQAQAGGESRLEARLEVQLASQEPREVELEVRYRTPCALWRPEHLARLLPGVGGAPDAVELRTSAVAWQRTGEAWEGVEVRFSTARPASAASAPLLEDDVVAARRKTEAERRTVVIAARDQTVQSAALGDGERAVEDMPGVDDGGEPVAFSAPAPMDLPSTGEPVRVVVQHSRAEAVVERVVLAERAQTAHLRASMTHKGEAPLLAGPLQLARGGSFVGLSRLDFVAPGEPFVIGFGPDDGVRVRRREVERRERAAVTGAQKIERTVDLFLSNLSDEPRKLSLTERIPVSEIEAVEVELKKAEGLVLDPKDGFLKGTVELAPRQTAQRTYKYELRAGSNVALPF